MRKLITIWVAAVMLLAACSAGGTIGDERPTGDAEDGDVTAITLITPESGGGYPAPSNPYPVSPVEALLPTGQVPTGQVPTGYPEMTVDVPPSDLTPAVGGDSMTTRPPSDGSPATPFPVPDRMLATLVRDLAALADVPIDEIDLAVAEAVVWPNAGLGCPAEGMAYVEVQVDGMRIVLDAGGRAYEFHTDGGQRYVLCRDGRPVSTGNIER